MKERRESDIDVGNMQCSLPRGRMQLGRETSFALPRRLVQPLHAISGFSPIAVRSITSRSANDELIFVTCGIADSHSLWMRS